MRCAGILNLAGTDPVSTDNIWISISANLVAMFQPDSEPRRLALSRIKLLLFACAVILAIHELLAAGGILRLPW